MKVLIIGGVAGGASCAARLRRLDEDAHIVLLEEGGHVSYANCGLPYYIGGVIEEEEELLLQTPESFYRRFRVDVRVRNKAEKISPETKTVTVRNLEDGSCYEESYDKLVLSPGAAPFRIPVNPKAASRVFTLRRVEDCRKIRDMVTAGKYRSAVVIGGGFIGLEVCENLQKEGIDVSVVEAMPQILPPFDEEIAEILHGCLRDHGTALYLNSKMEDISPSETGGCVVSLSGGKQLFCDFVVMAVGVRPDTALCREAGMELTDRGSILTDENFLTSLPDVYAIGDAVITKNRLTGMPGMTALAGPANKQGRLVADILCGRKTIPYPGVLGSFVIRLFDRTAAATGINERTCRQAGLDYAKIYLLPYDHATYYPGAEQMVMKVLFEKKTGKLLGMQCTGLSGVEKRVDVFAAALHFGGTVQDLEELDLCYAPPYSSAKDPVNFAGFVGDNLMQGISRFWYWDQMPERGGENEVLLDVRTPEEYEDGHLEGAVNIPVDELRERISELPKDKEIYLYCQVGIRGNVAQRILTQKGYSAWNLSGGYGLMSRIGKA